MTRQPSRFATRIASAGTIAIATAAAMAPADRVLAQLAQDDRPDVAAASPFESGITTKNVPEPSAVVIAATAAALEGWSIWKRRRRTAHANLIGTGAAGGRSSG